MPELPEVEHNRRNLDSWLRGTRLSVVHAPDALIVRPLSTRSFARQLTGIRVEAVERRGKWIRMQLAGGLRLFAHLGMTGWFERTQPGAAARFERVGFEVKRGGQRSRVSFVDPRRWGRLVLSHEDIATWAALGPDPLSDGVDPVALRQRLARSKSRTIKEALLDQTVLAGVGNIQAIEALWKAKIDPRSAANALGDAHLRGLVRGLHWTIERTLKDLAKGDHGARNPFRVYGRKGEPCPRCGTLFERVQLAGRTTTFCPGCQVRLSAGPKPVAKRAARKRAVKSAGVPLVQRRLRTRGRSL
jgi:formamidopyrimidine-DNA glycosylase